MFLCMHASSLFDNPRALKTILLLLLLLYYELRTIDYELCLM